MKILNLKLAAFFACALIIFSCGDAQTVAGTLTVKDADGTDVTSLEAPADGITKNLNVQCGTHWVMTLSEKWITASPKSGDGNGAFQLKIQPNTELVSRTGQVSIIDTDGNKVKIDVTQVAGEAPATIELKVMSFNILEGVKSGEKAGYEWRTTGRKERVIAMLTAEKPDILCLQECRRAQLQDLQEAFPDYTFYCYAKDGILKGGATTDLSQNIVGDPANDATFKNGGQRNVIGFKNTLFAVEDWGVFWLSDTPYRASNYKTTNGQKLTLWIKFKLAGDSGKNIYIACTHHIPSTYATTECPDVLTPSAEINVAELKKVIPEDATFMIFGDFNCNDISTQIAPLTAWLGSARQDCTDTDESPTYSSGSRLDHIFYKNATPLSFKVISCTAALSDTTPTTYGLLSDHKPVYSNMLIDLR